MNITRNLVSTIANTASAVIFAIAAMESLVRENNLMVLVSVVGGFVSVAAGFYFLRKWKAGQ